jgi:chromate reductase
MILVISGTNRENSNSIRLAKHCQTLLENQGATTQLLDLATLPLEVLSPTAYSQKPEGWAPFQQAVDTAKAIWVVVPEYNGSFPGALKMFIDMLEHPQSLKGLPCAFVGLASGRWGAIRAVEQLEMVFQYRYAHLFNERLFVPAIHNMLDSNDALTDTELAGLLEQMVSHFITYAQQLNP